MLKFWPLKCWLICRGYLLIPCQYWLWLCAVDPVTVLHKDVTGRLLLPAIQTSLNWVKNITSGMPDAKDISTRTNSYLRLGAFLEEVLNLI